MARYPQAHSKLFWEYIVAAPEIFHRLEIIGTTIEPDDLGRLRGNDNARRTDIVAYDADPELF